MTKPNIETARQRVGAISDEAYNIILQAEAWFNSRKDHLSGVLLHAQEEGTQLQVGETTIDNEDIRLGFALGIQVALTVFGNWPISINESETDQDD